MIENYREIMDDLIEKNIMFYDPLGGGIQEVINFCEDVLRQIIRSQMDRI